MRHAVEPSYQVPDYFVELALAFIYVRDTRSSGRLSIRNTDRMGLAHLYFKQARLIHVTGDKRDGEEILNDVIVWSKGRVRFDREAMIQYDDVTWQQVEVYIRWLALVEMHASIHGVARTRLDGLAQQLAQGLPRKPIALPDMVENYEEREEAARVEQWQRLSNGMQQFIDRTLPEEQREQFQRVSQSAIQRIGDAVQHAAETAQEGARQAVEAAQAKARRTVLRAEDFITETLNRERRQQFVQSAQQSMQSVEKSVTQTAGQLAVVPQKLRSIRPSISSTPVVNGRVDES